MREAWGKREMHAGFSRGKLKERDPIEYVGVDERIILQ
jgi:hypothetical protein